MNKHIPVLYDEVLDVASQVDLDRSKYKFFDGTLGGGGHTKGLLEAGLRVVSSDLDQAAIDRVTGYLKDKDFYNNWQVGQGNFADVITTFTDRSLLGALVDLGYSSNQLEIEQKGFSYLQGDQVLDLRYDETSGKPCYKLILELKNVQELGKILFNYSGETLSRRIAERIFEASHGHSVLTVENVVNAVTAGIPAKFIRSKNAILSRIWQALRIWTNDEFASLKKFLNIAPNKLEVGGVLIVISFHSLEDKLVAKHFRTLAKPIEIDEMGNKERLFELLTPHAITPGEKELTDNPRSRSAMMRALKRLV